VLGTIVPLILLIIIILYRHVKRKNLEIAMMEQKNFLAEMERHRWQLYEKMQADHLKREKEITEYLTKHQAQPSTSSGPLNLIDAANVVDDADGGDSTDDEFFEMPLPPLPMKSPTVSGQTSIIDNEAVESKTPTARIEETPKVGNAEHIFSTHFKFPPSPTRDPPPLPLENSTHITFRPSLPPPPPPPPPRQTSISSSPPPSTITSQSSSLVSETTTPPIIINPHPVIIDVTPKSLLESEL
jgi:hypothetical protein